MAKATPDDRKATALFASIFGGFSLLTFVVGFTSGEAIGLGFGTAGAGIAIASFAFLTLGAADAAGRRHPNLVGRILLLVGAAVMSAGPFIMMNADVDFTEQIGSSSRPWSMGIHSVIVWTISVIIVWRTVLAFLRYRRAAQLSSGDAGN